MWENLKFLFRNWARLKKIDKREQKKNVYYFVTREIHGDVLKLLCFRAKTLLELERASLSSEKQELLREDINSLLEMSRRSYWEDYQEKDYYVALKNVSEFTFEIEKGNEK